MLSRTLIAGVLLGLSQIPSGIAQPVDTSSFIISLTTSDYFPNAKGDLSPFDVDVRYLGYNATTQSWLAGLNPASGTSDEEKAVLMTEAAYAKPFNVNDSDMTRDVNSLLAAVAGNRTALAKRDNFVLSTAHTVNWEDCASYFACASGTTCNFALAISSNPRSQCQDGCCISWSTYTVNQDFFANTWNNCNAAVEAGGNYQISCEGYGTSDGGDVCLSNRATGCGN